ncbi:hypothetical protein NST74_07220 [Paenibacillus sp. FSL F4-0125]|uniref:hypothetical protein n=1 Tax=Paenibacillus sp. FSL F4-0125 TaxID=2954730 RepID=UPI0030F8729C
MPSSSRATHLLRSEVNSYFTRLSHTQIAQSAMGLVDQWSGCSYISNITGLYKQFFKLMQIWATIQLITSPALGRKWS